MSDDPETADARRALLGTLAARAINITEAHMAGFAACGLLCPGGSENRGCDCSNPQACKMKAHPMYQHYVTYRAGQMHTDWFVSPAAGQNVLVRARYAPGAHGTTFEIKGVE